jgi:hypothetical protein
MSATAATTDTWTCLQCGQSFGPGEWFCASKGAPPAVAWAERLGRSPWVGWHHTVKSKTYYLPERPPVAYAGRDAATGRPLPAGSRTIISTAPPTMELGDQDDGGVAVFLNARYETADPEEQHILDARAGWWTKDEWQEAWLTPQEQVAELEREVAELRKNFARKGK